LLKELKQRRGDFNWALELKNGKESSVRGCTASIGLAKISAKCERVPALLSPDQERTLRNAMGLGLSKKVTRLALGYFSTKYSAGAKSVS